MDQPPAALGSDLFPLASIRASLQHARHQRNSRFLRHLPFLFWIVSVGQPRSFVQLGLSDGVPYFAGCQAMSRLGPDVQCHGIGAEPGDPEGLEALRSYNSRFYQEMSRLRDGGLLDSSWDFPEGSVDLLLVDLDLGACDLDALLGEWSPKLSRRGVLLIHRVSGASPDGPAGRALLRLSERHPTILMEDGDGMLAVLHGPEQDERLARLASLPSEGLLKTEVHQLFARLGQLHQAEWLASNSSADRQRLRELEKTLKRFRALEKELAAAYEAYDGRSVQIANLQARLFDLESRDPAESPAVRERLEAQAREIESHKARELEQVEALLRRDTELAAKQQRLNAAEAEAGVLRDRLRARSKELAKLVALAERLDQRLQGHSAEIEALKRELGARDRKLARLAAGFKRLNRRHKAVLNSTSWRLTAPVRSLGRMIRRWR